MTGSARAGFASLGLLCLTLAAAGAQGGKLVYGLVPNAPPTTYVDAAGRPTGFFVELYSRIMDELGIAYEYEIGPFSELYPKLVAGEVDFFTTLQKTPEREGLFVFPDQGVAAGWSQLFVALGTEIQSVLDLQHRKIGVVRDDRNGINFRAYIEQLAIPCEIVEYPDFEALVRGVEKGEVFGGVQSNWFVSAEKRVQPTTLVFAPFRSYPVLSRNSAHRADFDRVIARYAELLADPDSYYFQLQAKWLGHEVTETVVVPPALIAALATLLAAAVVCFVVIQALTRKLRQANRDLERKVEERTALLVKSEKLAALGTLVAGIAHELNSPLHALLSSVESLQDSLFEHLGPREPLGPDGRALVARVIAARGAGGGLAMADSRTARKRLDGRIASLGIADPGGLADLCLDLGLAEPDRELLGILAGASDPAREAAREAAGRLEALDIMKDASARMSSVIKALRIYTHQDQKGEMSPVSIALQLDAVLSLFANRIKGRIEVERDYGALPRYRCHAEQLQQVWMNLVGNAVDAMGDSGRLELRAGVREGTLVVEVADTGPGIPAGSQGRIFEPFFTTKTPGEGTGLGLSIAREIVATHGGTISFSSRPGRTLFSVSLPAAGIEAGPPGGEGNLDA